MEKGWLIDSNTAIEFLAALLPDSELDRLQHMLDRNLGFLSVINQIELLGFNASPDEMDLLEAFVLSCPKIAITNEVVEKTIALRRAHRIKIPDAIIAATALEFNLTLITRNTRDFKAINGLEVVNLHN